MTQLRSIPELLAPAGSLEAVRAAVANGADAVYLGAERFNARDDGAQLTMDEVEEACRIAHERGRRIYLTLNTLLKPSELHDALLLLGDAIDRGVDAAIVQDIGLIRLIPAVYPGFEIHGSTQMTMHDASGVAVARELGIERVVLARENTIDDIRAIRVAVPDIGLESFVHGALCISYSGQCYMSGMISERSANRGSCAQSCRKDYLLEDAATGAKLDQGYLISAKDLGAYDEIAALADAGVSCLKVEGRKKKPEYVATVTSGYRTFLERVRNGEQIAASPEEVQPLVQIFSRGFTSGMLEGRQGREYITRGRPDKAGVELGVVESRTRDEIVLRLSERVAVGDGLGFEPPEGAAPGQGVGFAVTSVRDLPAIRGAIVRQAVTGRGFVPAGWKVVRTSHAALLERARASYAAMPDAIRSRKTRMDIRVFGSAGSPLKAIVTAGDDTVTVRSEIALAPAQARSLDAQRLRDQFGRLGETPFVLGTVDESALAPGLFLPLSELNHVRQSAVAELLVLRDWTQSSAVATRTAAIEGAVATVNTGGFRNDGMPDAGFALTGETPSAPFALAAEVYDVASARAAADAGATEIVLDPFLRHPAPPLSRVSALAADLAQQGITLRLRTPTIVRPADRGALDRWLALPLPINTGHLGLMAELAREGRNVVADYAVNCFNQHTAAELFRLGASRLTLSIELTATEMLEVSAPWSGAGFEVVLFGRPEGMTLEHCVLSAAFDREPTTCRDLCVKSHTDVRLTDPAGYTFAVATDSDCRNRLLHSRPVDGLESLTQLWGGGVRSYRLLFNVPGDPVASIVSEYRRALEGVARGDRPEPARVRELVGGAFTRGHFARAV